MVRLARGAMMPNRGRGRGRPGPPMLNPRDHMMGLRSHDIRPGFGPPLPGLGPPLPPRGPMGLPRRMPPAPLPPPPPMPPRPPLHMRPGFPPPPRAPLGRRPFPPGPPGLLPPPMRPLPPPPPPPLVMARGGLMRRPGLRPGMGLKRLGTAANGRIKRTQKRKPKLKEKSEEAELNKPWVTEALKNEIIKKHKLYQTAREKKQDSDWQAFKEQRNLVAKMTNAAKLEYIGSHPDADVDQIMSGRTDKGA